MLLLLATTDTMSVITSAAATLDVVASIQDKTTASGAIASASQRTAITTATTTTVVSAPASGVERNVVELTLRNKHASLATDVTVQLAATGPTLYEMFKVTLNAGDTLEYIEGIGYFVLTNAAALDKRLIVTSDVVNATTSFADITGLTTPLLSGKHYNFMAVLIHQTNATTTGAQFGVNIGAAPTSLILHGYAQITSSVTAAAYGGSAAVTALDTAMVVETTGPGAVNMIAVMHGWIVPSANGTFAVRCKSEVAVASGLTVKAGSHCIIWEATG